jgi:hypothetical protein
MVSYKIGGGWLAGWLAGCWVKIQPLFGPSFIPLGWDRFFLWVRVWQYYQIESNYIVLKGHGWGLEISAKSTSLSSAMHQAAAGCSIQPGCGGTYTRWAEKLTTH